jgi:membrane-bound lytic murein transglycosylase A
MARWVLLPILATLMAACADLSVYRAPPSVQEASRPDPTRSAGGGLPAPGAETGAPAVDYPAHGRMLQQPRSRWIPVDWAELQGFGNDTLGEAWAAWLRSCERPGTLVAVCADVKRLAGAGDEERRAWMLARLQPYRIENLEGESQGLLTGYYEPVADARRLPDARFKTPLYRVPGPPAPLGSRKPWYSREEIDTLPEPQAALRGREIAWLEDPVSVLNLQIQGSGRLRITEADGRERMVRVAYAATNDQPYRSVGSWLLQKGEVKDASWAGIRQWVAANPGRLQEMLWVNPRVVFFQEQMLTEADTGIGPKGAQGVPLTAGRSIAVDPQSIPYGAPVWLASSGYLPLQRLVLAQDTGSAITGAVRADYFVGTGPEASAVAGRIKQPLRLWVLWPK